MQRLHAVDITTGNERPNSPTVIAANVNSNVFTPASQNQRAALALSQGVVYIAWASFCDVGPYSGWVMAYNSTTLAQVGALPVTTDARPLESGWPAPAPVFDSAGNVYYATGNGNWDGASQFGESLLKLAPSSLSVLDYFTPSDYNTLNGNDLDFGSAGPTFMPGSNLIVQGGKTGIIYLLNSNNLGQEAAGDVQIPQYFQAVDTTIRPNGTHHIHNANVFWNSPEGLNLYVWGENDFLHLFSFNATSQTFTLPATATGPILPPQGMPGGMLTLSANGSQAGSGIIWASVPRAGDAVSAAVPGNLYAFNAENLGLLWSSTGTGQDMLNFSKGSIPVVANGKLYVGSLSRFVEVYGLTSNGVATQDLALNKTATGSAPCTPGQTPSQAVNGSFSGGSNDEWCSSVANPWLMVDLGAQYSINRFVVEHAQAGGEDWNSNTAAYNIQVSNDGVNFTTVVNVTGNIYGITTNDVAPTSARYVMLNIVTPNQYGSGAAEIYEFQVFGPVADSFQVAAPTFGTPGGNYNTPQNVTLNTVTPGASIRYTTDGSAPSETAGTLYDGTSIAVNNTTVLNVIAYENGMTDSSIVSATYTLVAAPPVFDPAGGAYSSLPQGVSISTATPGASIRYTTDGSMPSETVGTLYAGTPVAIPNSTVLNAIAYRSGWSDSSVSTSTYSISGGAAGWYGSGWNYRKAVTINQSEVAGGASLTNFPVLFSVTDPNLATTGNGGGVGNGDGSDILFTASDGVTKLNHEVEYYNGATGQLIAWVQVPMVSATASTGIYVYYGNGGVGAQWNPSGVWDSNYKGVWHLGNGTSVTVGDSTSNGNNGSNSGAVGVAGEVEGGAGFDGSSSYITIPSGSYGYPAGGSTTSYQETTEVWFKTPGSGVIVGQDNGAAVGTQPGGWVPGLYVDSSGKLRGSLYWHGQAALQIASAGSYNDNHWHHAVDVYNNGIETLYVDGAAAGTETVAENGYSNNYVYTLGVGYTSGWSGGNGGWLYWNGALDEVRVSNTARSAGWIQTEYNNQSSPSIFLTEGGQENSGQPAAGSITATGGTPQSTVEGTAFGTALAATVKDAGGNVLSGVMVTFTAPGSGRQWCVQRIG